ncbi:MAG: GT2 family glycosyltransferase [Halioglobus sp.]|jgi:GT2 family glycosyltransferase
MDDSPPQPIHLTISVVLHLSCVELLARAISSVRSAVQEAVAQGSLADAQVYFVDNSCDAAYRAQVHEVMQTWPSEETFNVHYRAAEANKGFGHGHNRVIETLQSDIHLVLNPDAELDSEALHAGLSSLAKDPGIVLLSPRVTGKAGEQEFLCKRYPSVLVLLLRGFAPDFIRSLFESTLAAYEMRVVCQGDEQVAVDIASGCFMLVRSADLRAVGGFDEAYFLYFEDFDLSLRLAQRGRLVFDPALKIVHQGGYAAKKGLRHVKFFITSAHHFFSRHGWRWM